MHVSPLCTLSHFWALTWPQAQLSTHRHLNSCVCPDSNTQIHTLRGRLRRKGIPQETQRWEQNTSGSTAVVRSCGLSQIRILTLLGFGPYGFVYSFIKVIFHSPKIDFSSVINKNVIFHVIGLLTAEGPRWEKNPFAGHTPHPTRLPALECWFNDCESLCSWSMQLSR